MKRLIKKVASLDTPNDFLFAWTTDHYSVQPNDIEKMVSENQDCIYSGEVYRFVELFNVDYEGKSDEELINESMSKIKEMYKYSSFSTSARAIEYFITTDDRDFGVIIKSNISGLDIKQLTNKYKDELTSNAIFEYANTEDEIISLDSVNDFTIVGFVIEDEIRWI